ncbi:MAG: glycoside hydrolase family 36 protein [Acidimicrobiales bacterium]
MRLVFRIDGLETRGGSAPLRMFRNGYQSWSASGVATLGVDVDPSCGPPVPRLVRSTHHADEEPVEGSELRSEMVTVLADGGDECVLVGFMGGRLHDGTLRLTSVDADSGPATVELAAEAFLGGARLRPGEQRALHPVVVTAGADHATLLEGWAARYGEVEGARVDAAFQVGWCSWYQYFGNVAEGDLRPTGPRRRLALRGVPARRRLPAHHRRLAGHQRQVPLDLDQLAESISAAGRRPGIWIAPFLARPDATVAVSTPEWIARYRDGQKPLVGMWQPVWGGETWTLDTSHPEVQSYLEVVARDLVESGFTYLKLDFTYAPAADGVYHDPAMTPAERVRAGYDAIRRGAGEDAFILACGAPLGAVVGVADGVRIGADVAPHWHVREDQHLPGAYSANEPATVNAWQNTLARSFMHRRLWLNDPDCVMLRQSDTAMTADAVRTWAHAVAVSGGMVLVSDDLALLDARAHALLDEVTEVGRRSDAAATSGSPARCPDLLEASLPGHLTAGGVALAADPTIPTSTLRGFAPKADGGPGPDGSAS